MKSQGFLLDLAPWKEPKVLANSLTLMAFCRSPKGLVQTRDGAEAQLSSEMGQNLWADLRRFV